MASRTAILCLLAAMLLVGCNRTEAPSIARETDTQPAASPAVVSPKGDRLAPPVLVEVGGQPFVDGGGHKFPFVGDIDGDGLPDLLLGHQGHGRLAIHRNLGTPTAAQFDGPQWFDDQVPTGRIPKG